MEASTDIGGRSYHTKMDGSGRIVLPAEVRKEMKLSAGDELLVVEDKAGFHLKTAAQALREVQEYVASVVPLGVSLVEELLRERREEAARESRE
jgi:AbrB family looped-hinge helix DNA binding protein